MEETKNNSIIRCRNISADEMLSIEQYADIARLIYQTDPYIYPAIFGYGDEGIQCAISILSEVFECKKDEMFSKDNLYVLEERGRIIALILWYKGKLNWDPKYIIEIAEKKGIILDKNNIELVRKEYVEYCYADSTDNNNTVSIINVCVSENKRRTGIGSKILESFIFEQGSQTYELTVLADNAHAISVYKKFGFSIVKTEEGFALIPQRPLCYTMRREYANNGE
ncbi:MAG: GNAT family N-acetyltransferase [Lachnospiraceae bacterium]|nr:GNAT family N-acetyltransferase [Lachnospiraceae bacterium]